MIQDLQKLIEQLKKEKNVTTVSYTHLDDQQRWICQR